MDIRELVIGSGGARGILALGTLHELQKDGVLDNVRTFHGTSVGALLCAGLILGESCETLLDRIIKYPLRCQSTGAQGFGLDSGKSLRGFIKKVLRCRHDVTLQSLYTKTRKTLYICVCNVTKQCVEYWSHRTHPDMSLLRALQCSCTIPFIFKPVKIKTSSGSKSNNVCANLYVDGAVGRHIPRAETPERALTLHFSSVPSPISSWAEYLTALGNVQDTATTRYVISLESDIDPFSFEFSKEDAHTYFRMGQDQALLFMKKNM